MTAMSPKARAPLPDLFIQEWMDAQQIETQKDLAVAMKRSQGAISKKLSQPGKIDLQWLADFAAALKIRVPDLFVDPASADLISSTVRPKLEQLMAIAAHLDENDIDQLIGLFSKLRVPSPASKPRLEDPAALTTTAKSK